MSIKLTSQQIESAAFKTSQDLSSLRKGIDGLDVSEITITVTRIALLKQSCFEVEYSVNGGWVSGGYFDFDCPMTANNPLEVAENHLLSLPEFSGATKL
jgi:hypothetical protein